MQFSEAASLDATPVLSVLPNIYGKVGATCCVIGRAALLLLYLLRHPASSVKYAGHWERLPALPFNTGFINRNHRYPDLREWNRCCPSVVLSNMAFRRGYLRAVGFGQAATPSITRQQSQFALTAIDMDAFQKCRSVGRATCIAELS